MGCIVVNIVYLFRLRDICGLGGARGRRLSNDGRARFYIWSYLCFALNSDIAPSQKNMFQNTSTLLSVSRKPPPLFLSLACAGQRIILILADETTKLVCLRVTLPGVQAHRFDTHNSSSEDSCMFPTCQGVSLHACGVCNCLGAYMKSCVT